MQKMAWLHIIQYIGFTFSQITNSLLIYLIITRARELFGTYRHVMLTYAVVSLGYAWIDIIAQPIMHIKGSALIVYVDSPLKYEKWIGYDIICLFCASFALIVSFLAAQFFYRYVAMCKSESLHHIEGKKITLIFIPCVICFIFWFECVFWGMGMTAEKQEFIREEMKTFYNEDSQKLSFIAPMYWSIGDNGQKIWRIWDVMSSLGCVFVIFICFSSILFFSYKIYRSMKSRQKYMSSKTLELNRQIFITLVIQTILPSLMMYGPVGSIIIFPLFEIYLGKFSNIAGVSLAFYPCLEPIIAMVCIKEFRKTILKKAHLNKIGPTVTGPSVMGSSKVIQ